MSKRAILIFWFCVGSLQLLGCVLDFLGGSLDDPVRLLGLMMLEPGVSLIWDWVPRHVTTHSEYETAIAIAIAINLSVATLVFLIRVILQKTKFRLTKSTRP